MKITTFDYISCPKCKSDKLLLAKHEENGEDVISGFITCSLCKSVYEISEGIPLMVVPVSNDAGHEKVREANISYHDKIARKYDGSAGEAFQENTYFQERLYRLMLGFAARSGNDLLLDVGCGTGKVMKQAEKVFKSVIGVDISLGMLKIARDRGYEVVLADSMYLPFKDGVFNTVSLFAVLHHIYDYSAIFSEIGRVTKTKGILYTDWDPNKVDVYVLKFKPFRLGMSGIVRLLVEAGHRSMINEIEYEREKIEDKENHSRVLAEYHNMTEAAERGIDFDLIKGALGKVGFLTIKPYYHWHGYSLKTIVQGMDRPIEKLLLKILLSFDNNIERYLENIQIIAVKR